MLVLSGFGNVGEQGCNANTTGSRMYIEGYRNAAGGCSPRNIQSIPKYGEERQAYKGLIIVVTRKNPSGYFKPGELQNRWEIIIPMKGEFPGFDKAKAMIDDEE